MTLHQTQSSFSMSQRLSSAAKEQANWVREVSKLKTAMKTSYIENKEAAEASMQRQAQLQRRQA